MSVVRVAVAGSSGSIGTQTLDVVRAERDRFEVVGLGVGSSVDVLVAQALRVPPQGGGRRRSGPPGRGGRGAALRGGDPRPRRPGRRCRRRRERRRRLRRARRDPGDAPRRQAPGAGQQGVAHRGRPGRAAAAGHAGRRAGAGRLRALRRAPVPAGQRGPGPRAAAHRAHGQRRAVPRAAPAPSWPTSRSSRPSPTRRGAWARRSPSTRAR